jgi:hypothetical protein
LVVRPDQVRDFPTHHRLGQADESPQGELHQPLLGQSKNLRKRQCELDLLLGCASFAAKLLRGALFVSLICFLIATLLN